MGRKKMKIQMTKKRMTKMRGRNVSIIVTTIAPLMPI